jgi:hypothetical protein
LGGNILEARQQAETKEMTERKGYLALSVGIHIVFLNFRVCTVAQQPLDHGSNF